MELKGDIYILPLGAATPPINGTEPDGYVPNVVIVLLLGSIMLKDVVTDGHAKIFPFGNKTLPK